MRKIKHELLTKQKPRKYGLKEDIDLYSYASELYDELNRIGIIERMKEVPQLGVIKVPKKLQKKRYDYVMLQLYLHQLIKKNLRGQLRWSYNNFVNAREFNNGLKYNGKQENPSICDVLQILTIVYNAGHFYNTFSASRAVTMLASKDETFRRIIVNASSDPRYKESTAKILDEKNYQNFHLLNSLLILEQCDRSKQSVFLATEILYAYINESFLPEDNKLRYAFKIFRSVRTLSYIAYDLQIADTPFTIDLCNKNAMLLLLRELLSEYNNNKSTNRLVESIGKLLDDTVYNENSNAICYYKISRKIVNFLRQEPDFNIKNYYCDYLINKDSIFNLPQPHIRDYIQTEILKLTFQPEDKHISEGLLLDIERVNNTRVGYYDRHSGEQTILISVKNNCDTHSKKVASFKTMKCAVSALRRINNISSSDARFLLCTKFFMFYLFGENPIEIKPTVDKEKCVLCTRGKKSRIAEINKLLNGNIGNEDARHETTFMISCLKKDRVNDTSISLPASIVVYQKDNVGQKLCEFDGMIIHPMRKTEQVIFLEAKNTSDKPSYGKNCLKEKLNKLSLEYNLDDIEVIKYDAMLKCSI